jgi:hypothetical protein
LGCEAAPGFLRLISASATGKIGIEEHMYRTPPLQKAVAILCLALTGNFGVALAAPPLRPARPARPAHRHRARIVESADPAKDDIAQ